MESNMIKVTQKSTGETKVVSKTYFNNHQTQFEVYVEPTVVKKVTKKVTKPKVEKEVKEDKE